MKKWLLILVLLPFATQSQDFARDLQRDLSAFYEKHFPLKTYLMTNQPSYGAGDTIFYKVHLVTADGLRPVGGRSIVHVVLRDENENNVVANQISVRDGFGANQMVVPPTIKPGRYKLTSYTEWMLNGDPALFGSQLITIGKIENSANVNYGVFPEGGSLVTGLQSRVVATGPPDSKAQVVGSGNEVVAEFTFGDDGLGVFYITPGPNNSYRMKLHDKGEIGFPQPAPDGAVMLVNHTAEAIRVIAQVPASSAHRMQPLHLVLSAQGTILHTAELVFKSQPFLSVNIPVAGLPPGIIRVTLMSDDRSILSDRSVLIQPEPVAVTSQVSTRVYPTREKVKYRLAVPVNAAARLKPQVALTTYNADLTSRRARIPSIAEHLFITSDVILPSMITMPEEKGRRDLVMIGARNVRFDWSKIREISDNHNFVQNIRFAGKAVNADNTPVADSTLVTIFLQKTVAAYQAYTDADGFFEIFMLIDFFGEDEVFFRVEKDSVMIEGARIIPEETAESHGLLTAPSPPVTPYDQFVERRNTISRSYYYYGEKPGYSDYIPHRTTVEDELNGADLAINLEDYLLFPTMSETLREIVPLVQHRRVRNRDVIRVYNEDISNFPDADPVFVIDGILTDDVRYFLSLDPSRVASIKVIYRQNKTKALGPLGRGGIVIVDTKIPGNDAAVPRSAYSFKIGGLNERRRFHKVNHAASPQRIPDLRTTLEWQPDLRVNEKGEAIIEFYTSDVPGNYEIVVEGLTGEGMPFTAGGQFEVKFRPAAN